MPMSEEEKKKEYADKMGVDYDKAKAFAKGAQGPDIGKAFGSAVDKLRGSLFGTPPAAERKKKAEEQ